MVQVGWIVWELKVLDPRVINAPRRAREQPGPIVPTSAHIGWLSAGQPCHGATYPPGGLGMMDYSAPPAGSYTCIRSPSTNNPLFYLYQACSFLTYLSNVIMRLLRSQSIYLHESGLGQPPLVSRLFSTRNRPSRVHEDARPPTRSQALEPEAVGVWRPCLVTSLLRPIAL